jgi:hypothetical protein
LPFLLFCFCQSMCMGDLPVFCSLLQLLSSVVHSFPCRVYLHPLLRLFLDIWFHFGIIVNEIFLYFFLYSFSVCSLFGYRKATDFCNLIL